MIDFVVFVVTKMFKVYYLLAKLIATVIVMWKKPKRILLENGFV